MALPYRDAIHDWTFNIALPWWAANGVDREHGGYVEQVTPDGRDAGVAFCPSSDNLRPVAA